MTKNMIEILAIIAVVGFIALYVFSIGGKKTRLFRRIWSSERELRRSGSQHYVDFQEAAIQELYSIYGVENSLATHLLKANAENLFVDAQRFDAIYKKNMGVEVAPILAQRLMEQFGDRMN